MAPNQNYMLTDASGEPVSRTYQYRKVMKPLLERKRRARINRCLDELKELMTGALQAVSWIWHDVKWWKSSANLFDSSHHSKKKNKKKRFVWSSIFFFNFFKILAGRWKCCEIGKSRHSRIDRSSFTCTASSKSIGIASEKFVCGEIQGRIPSLCGRSEHILGRFGSGYIDASCQTLGHLPESHWKCSCTSIGRCCYGPATKPNESSTIKRTNSNTKSN